MVYSPDQIRRMPIFGHLEMHRVPHALKWILEMFNNSKDMKILLDYKVGEAIKEKLDTYLLTKGLKSHYTLGPKDGVDGDFLTCVSLTNIETGEMVC